MEVFITYKFWQTHIFSTEKSETLYFAMDSRIFTIEGLFDTSALPSATLESDLEQI